MDFKDSIPVVVSIILIGLLLGIGVYVLAEVGDNLSNTLGTVTHETSLWINETPTTVATVATADGFNTFAVIACYANVTVGDESDTPLAANTSINSANYTYDADAGTITSATAGAENYTDVACNYTYYYGSYAAGSVDDTKDGLVDFAGWIAVIVVVIAAAMVLGIVLRSFGQQVNI